MPQVFGDGVQLPNSPVLIRVVDRDCAAAYGPASLRAADDAGACVCGEWAVEAAGGACLLVGTLAAVVAVPLVAALLLAGGVYLRLKTRALDGCPPCCCYAAAAATACCCCMLLVAAAAAAWRAARPRL